MMDRWGPKHVQLTHVMNKLTHWNTLCIFLVCIHITRWYTVPTISCTSNVNDIIEYCVTFLNFLWTSKNVLCSAVHCNFTAVVDYMISCNSNEQSCACAKTSMFSCLISWRCISFPAPVFAEGNGRLMKIQ